VAAKYKLQFEHAPQIAQNTNDFASSLGDLSASLLQGQPGVVNAGNVAAKAVASIPTPQEAHLMAMEQEPQKEGPPPPEPEPEPPEPEPPKPEPPKRKFKVGDKVKVLRSRIYPALIGLEGTVLVLSYKKDAKNVNVVKYTVVMDKDKKKYNFPEDSLDFADEEAAAKAAAEDAAKAAAEAAAKAAADADKGKVASSPSGNSPGAAAAGGVRGQQHSELPAGSPPPAQTSIISMAKIPAIASTVAYVSKLLTKFTSASTVEAAFSLLDGSKSLWKIFGNIMGVTASQYDDDVREMIQQKRVKFESDPKDKTADNQISRFIGEAMRFVVNRPGFDSQAQKAVQELTTAALEGQLGASELANVKTQMLASAKKATGVKIPQVKEDKEDGDAVAQNLFPDEGAAEGAVEGNLNFDTLRASAKKLKSKAKSLKAAAEAATADAVAAVSEARQVEQDMTSPEKKRRDTAEAAITAQNIADEARKAADEAVALAAANKVNVVVGNYGDELIKYIGKIKKELFTIPKKAKEKATALKTLEDALRGVFSAHMFDHIDDLTEAEKDGIVTRAMQIITTTGGSAANKISALQRAVVLSVNSEDNDTARFSQLNLARKNKPTETAIDRSLEKGSLSNVMGGFGKPSLKRGRFEKGSDEAKAFMAELRAKRRNVASK
jgi:hypothetical protein